MSTPPVLAVVTGRCSSFVPQCIGLVHKNLFYTALLLLAIGVSTHSSSLPRFKEDQFQFTTKKHYKSCSWQQFSYVTLAFVVPAVTVYAVGYSKSWLIKFGTGALTTVVSTLIFSIGLYSYKPPSGRWSYLTGIFTGRDIDTVMVPICMIYVLLGVVSSLGPTFFMEQATDMNHYIGRLKVPDLILPALKHLVKSILKTLLKKGSPWTARFTLPGILVSSMISILCCITAAKVETRRLDTVKSHGFIDKPEETIPMSMFWLVPQFLLLGLAEQIGSESIVNLFYFPLHGEYLFSEERQSRLKYMETLANALKGVGYIGGMLSVYAVGKVKPSWFQYTLNRSQLDNYYWTLAAFSAANLGFGLLTMSTPPVLAVLTGSCSSFVPQCIGPVHKILFYTALLLLAIGESTHLSSWPQFGEDQFKTEEVFTSKTEKVYKRSCQLFSLATLLLVVPVCAVIAVGLLKSWLIKFGIGAISTVVSTLIFSSGLYSYKRPSGESSHLNGVFTIILGSGIPAVMFFIVSCMAVVPSGVIASIGNTFFMEQATDMNHYIGRPRVPTIILPAITAAKVESRRLDVVKSHGFIDKPEETIPMTMFWLLPQFLLLGLAQEIGKQSIANLCYAPLWWFFRSRSFCKYMQTVADAVSGVGYIGGMSAANLVSFFLVLLWILLQRRFLFS
ncbi:hypothetical protein ACFX2J_009754 [Malus domestica]